MKFYYYLFALLGHLEDVFPPPSGHHAILLTKYGSDSEGWKDQLTIALRLPPDESRMFFLEEADLDKPFTQLSAEIKRLVDGQCA